MAEPVHDFFHDLSERISHALLNESGGDDPRKRVETAIMDVRARWNGAQVYISRYEDHDDWIFHIRNAWMQHQLQFCRDHGITISTLNKIIHGRPRKSGPDDPQNEMF